MKIKVGDILRSKHDMIITVQDDEEEQVDEGEYFAVIDYCEYKEYTKKCVGWTLLSQKNMTISKWNEAHCILEENFTKV